MSLDRHVDLLGLLMTVGAFLGSLLGVAMVSLGAGAGVLARSAEVEMRGAATVTAVTYLGVGATLLLWASANAVAGVALRRRRGWGRRMSLMLSVVNVLVLPFGTALAAYAFWVLLNDQARRLFAREQVAS